MTPSAGHAGRGTACVLAASVLWGTTGTAATFAPAVGPLAIGAAAMGLGGLLQALTAAAPMTRQRAALRVQWRLVVLGAVAVAVFPLAFYTSMRVAGVAVGTVVSIGPARIGDGSIAVFAGPCAVESREQMLSTAAAAATAGAVGLRGGAFKPRTSPYTFQGLKWTGLDLLAQARSATGLPVLTEVVDPRHVKRFAEVVDGFQIGARNMQNFALLSEVGAAGLPVVLKRGFGCTVDELLAAKKLGRKSGEGFYRWVDGKALKAPTPAGSPPADLIDRLILVLVNECVACLREAVVASADQADAAVLFGTGFAPFRGGPVNYARTRGVTNVMSRLEELAARYGERFRPDVGWHSLGDGPKA